MTGSAQKCPNRVKSDYKMLKGAKIDIPRTSGWPIFFKKGNLNQDRPVFSFQIRLKVKSLISCANYCPFILILITLNEDACIVKKAQEGILSQLSLLSCYEWILMGRCAVYKNSAISFHKTSRIFYQVSKIYTARDLCITKAWLKSEIRPKHLYLLSPRERVLYFSMNSNSVLLSCCGDTLATIEMLNISKEKFKRWTSRACMDSFYVQWSACDFPGWYVRNTFLFPHIVCRSTL